jgi:hypothetical protein
VRFSGTHRCKTGNLVWSTPLDCRRVVVSDKCTSVQGLLICRAFSIPVALEVKVRHFAGELSPERSKNVRIRCMQGACLAAYFRCR